MTALLLAAAVTAGPTVADHPDPHGWLSDWNRRVAHETLSRPLIDEWRVHTSIIRELPARRRAPQAARHLHRSPELRPSVEAWRPLVAEHFPAEHVDAALEVMACESAGDPNARNPHSTAAGLFQFLRGWWSGTWGYPPFDPFDPEQNVKAAAWLSAGGTDWGHWVCRP